MSPVIGQIRDQRVIPVLRSTDPSDAVATAKACAAGGMRAIELTTATPDVESAIEQLRSSGLVVGLGTVTRAAEITAAAAAGAQFIVSFATDERVVAAAKDAGLAVIPGALTPSEVAQAVRLGPDAVKLFPARLISPAYLADLRAVLPETKFLVTGGLTARDLGPWLAAGALAVGIGSDLGSASADGARAVTRRCEEVLAAAQIEVPA